MLIDLAIIGLAVALAVWGYRRGFSSDGLALIGFGVGALLGSSLAPLILDGGRRDPYAAVVAVPAALLVGGIFAAMFERVPVRMRRPALQRSVADGVAGAVVAVCLGVLASWALAAAATKVDRLGGPVRDSAVIDNLNAVVPPPGPLAPSEEESDQLPIIAGPSPRVGAATPGIKRDPQVRAAARSVAKLTALACGHNQSGTGWVAGEGVVVTNAHVVAGSDEIRVQIAGRGMLQEAEPIWYDARNDVAIVRAEGVRGVRALPVVRDPKPGTLAAILGFPGGGAYSVKAARLGRTAKIPGRKVGGQFVRREVTSVRAAVRPGNSGGPAVDRRGRVITMVFAGQKGGHGAYGVPTPVVANALRRAGPAVETGKCPED